MIIAYGRNPQILPKILAGEPVGTLFLAQGQAVSPRKRWIEFTVKPRGRLILDAGAGEAIERRARACWRSASSTAKARFVKGDVVALRTAEGREFARGLTNYPSAEIAKIKGLRSHQIAQVLGYHPYDEVVHRDNLAVTKQA